MEWLLLLCILKPCLVLETGYALWSIFFGSQTIVLVLQEWLFRMVFSPMIVIGFKVSLYICRMPFLSTYVTHISFSLELSIGHFIFSYGHHGLYLFIQLASLYTHQGSCRRICFGIWIALLYLESF